MNILNNIKVGPKIIAVGVIGAIALVVITVVMLTSLNDVGKKFDFLVHHDTPVLQNGEQLVQQMVNMETGLRGYMATGDEGYLDPYNSGIIAFDEIMEAEQELVNDNPAAVADLQAIQDQKDLWVSEWAEPSMALRAEVNEGDAAWDNFDEISARTIGKERFDALRGVIGSVTDKFKAGDSLEGLYIMEKVTLAVVNMETGQRGFLLSGEESSLDPYINGERDLAEAIGMFNTINYGQYGITSSDIGQMQTSLDKWKTDAAEPEIAARRETVKYPKTQTDIEAMMATAQGKQYMDAIRADLTTFLDAEIALNLQRADDVSSKQSATQTQAIIIAGVGILAALALAYLISRNITKPLNNVATVAQAMAGGDLSNEVKVNSKDEIGQMAGSFKDMIAYMKEMANAAEKMADGDLTVRVHPKSQNDALGNAFAAMITNLGKLIGQVSENAIALGEASEQLASAADQAGEASTQVAGTSQQLAKGAGEQAELLQSSTSAMQQLEKVVAQVATGSQEQSREIQTASAAVTQVSGAADQVASNATSAASGSQEAAALATNGAEKAKNTIDGMARITETVDDASNKVRDLGAASEQIGKIVAVIDDIAAQTNLLALNAAIEAARAGEHGRGFAVVSDEVRKLAERTVDATKEIADLVGNVQNGVTDAVAAMEQGANEVQSGYVLATEAGEVLAQIMQSSAGVSAQITQISAAAEEMSASSNELVKVIDNVGSVAEQNSASSQEMASNSQETGRSIESAAGIAEENSAATEQMSATSEQMGAQVQEIVASAASLKQMAGDMQEAVSVFKIGDSKGDREPVTV